MLASHGYWAFNLPRGLQQQQVYSASGRKNVFVEAYFIYLFIFRFMVTISLLALLLKLPTE